MLTFCCFLLENFSVLKSPLHNLKYTRLPLASIVSVYYMESGVGLQSGEWCIRCTKTKIKFRDSLYSPQPTPQIPVISRKEHPHGSTLPVTIQSVITMRTTARWTLQDN